MPFITGLLKRLVLATVVSASLMGLAPVAQAQSIVVQGNRRVDAEAIRSYFTGGSQVQVNQAVKDLYATGQFSNVSVRRTGGSIIVAVSENNSINRVVFEGNSKLKGEVLVSEVQSKSRGAYSAATVQADVQRILEIYRRTGRAAATVTSRTVDLPNGRIDVVFTIVEGDKTGVKSINFVGNQVYSSGKLAGLMQTTEMNYLSWLKTTDVYDPDKIAADQELIRRYYLKNGYADFRVVGSDAHYDSEQKGYIITITVEEGPQYRIGTVSVDSRLRDVDGATLAPLVKLSTGDVYDGDLVEKSVDVISRDVARRGFAFSQVRPKGDRDPATRTITLGFVVDDGPRVYIERINIRGNTRTRDYVVRREFDIGEGDAYNRQLVDRAEKRLNNLGFFKKVKVSNEPGSSPDRIVINVDVEDQPTGSFSIAGGYSTTDGLLAEVSVTESNFLGRGQYVRASASRGQNSQGYELSFSEPYFLDRRLAAGVDLFRKQTNQSRFSQYQTIITGGTVHFGLPVTDDLSFSPRYSLYKTQIKLPNTASTPFNDCIKPLAGVTPLAANDPLRLANPATYGANPLAASVRSCLTNGEGSLAVKESKGSQLTSLVGYTLAYNTLDNNKSPTAGIYAELKQDFAGAGGDSKFVRSTGDIRYYREVYDEVVALVHVQGGNIIGFGGSKLRIVDNFNLGPGLVRGFAPGGIGPRDVSAGIDTKTSGLGGTTYFGGSVELQFPIVGLPKEIGLKGAVFADAGTLFNYNGRTNFTPGGGACIAQNVAPRFTQGTCINVHDSHKIRSSVGASILWASPLGPIRFDYAFALSQDKLDVKQAFRFSGGTNF